MGAAPPRHPGDRPAVVRAGRHPTSAFVTGRVLAVVLCMLGVAGVFAVGRRL